MFKKLKAHDFFYFFDENLSHFLVRYSSGVAMATVMYVDEWKIDSLVLGHNIEDRKVSAKLVICVPRPYVKIEVVRANGS